MQTVKRLTCASTIWLLSLFLATGLVVMGQERFGEVQRRGYRRHRRCSAKRYCDRSKSKRPVVPIQPLRARMARTLSATSIQADIS